MMVLTLPTVLLGGGHNRILRYDMWAYSGEAISDGPVVLCVLYALHRQVFRTQIC